MSLAIDVEKVTAVLLADGWHQVAKKEGGVSTFEIDAYEFTSLGDATLTGGQDKHASSAGAKWTEGGGTVFCPLTAVLALKY